LNKALKGSDAGGVSCLSEVEIRDLISAHDTNNDQCIDYGEFCKMMEPGDVAVTHHGAGAAAAAVSSTSTSTGGAAAAAPVVGASTSTSAKEKGLLEEGGAGAAVETAVRREGQ